ncbi:kinase domain protein (macronuclear) [Tetrahymena thermophila SB210]|uniref:Kinase domain protein n=1 Tax=Tetrahymena thermophila (strain SB210) TaxID=312017 RepID=W7XAL3_TETTS|nr:kinase domain protein [Tetrahymena thermophila SB210]EWS73453.1 kinase domain protein [Tetrahymena thermophila SB210]|eukprot:XP_012654024.1 kinase domain protein [Tetrahymena thermophila SB210]
MEFEEFSLTEKQEKSECISTQSSLYSKDYLNSANSSDLNRSNAYESLIQGEDGDNQSEEQKRRVQTKAIIKNKNKKLMMEQKQFSIVSCIGTQVDDNPDNFILFGEIFCYFKSFLKYCRIGESIAPEYCYLSDFRPVISTQIKNQMIYAYLDCNDMKQQVDEIKNKQIISNNFRKIDYICRKLKSLSDNNAYIFTNHLENYKALIQQYADMVEKVHSTFDYNIEAIQEQLNANFEESLKKANEILDKIQLENPNIILQFFIKKLDAFSLTSKTNMTGGNSNFIELISGQSNPNFISYYFTKFGTPEVLDWKGIVEITMAQFTGNQCFEFDLQSIDGYSIPAKASYNFILLNSREIIPGFSISDVLEIYSYEVNPQILKCLKTKRSLTVQKNTREDICYTIKSEIFLQKFYPEMCQKVNQSEQNSNPYNSNSKIQNQKFSNLDNFSQMYDPCLLQQEIQSELFRINRQINSKLF